MCRCVVSLACGRPYGYARWPRVLWLNPDNDAPGFHTAEEAKQADATTVLGDQEYLSGYDALESTMHILGRRVARTHSSGESARLKSASSSRKTRTTASTPLDCASPS